VGWLPARGLQLRWASSLLKRPGRLGDPKANNPDSWACQRGHRRAVTAAVARTVASSPAVRRWPGGGSVGAMSTSGAESGRRARRRQREPPVEAARRGDVDGDSTRWRPTEEATSVDGGVPMGLDSCKGVKGTIRLS
jgi:hypothetical protein